MKNKMMKNTLVLTGLMIGLMMGIMCFAFLAPALAHEHGKHLMGTVDSINNNEIVIATSAGAKTSATLTAETRYVRGKNTILLTDIKLGEKAVVHAKTGGNGKGLIAEEVHVGAKKK